MDDALFRLQNWYVSQCDGDWEHHHGISIESCDNPGWWVKIGLTGTAMASRPCDTRAEGVNAEGFALGDRWFHCYLKDEVWNGAGDESRLPEILQAFLDWASPDTSALEP